MNYRHISCKVVTLPPLGADPAADRAVRAGIYRRVSSVTLPDGNPARIGVTKGVTFQYPDRAKHRAAVLAERRAR